jgi:hypothetical protein
MTQEQTFGLLSASFVQLARLSDTLAFIAMGPSPDCSNRPIPIQTDACPPSPNLYSSHKTLNTPTLRNLDTSDFLKCFTVWIKLRDNGLHDTMCQLVTWLRFPRMASSQRSGSIKGEVRDRGSLFFCCSGPACPAVEGMFTSISFA